MSIRSRGIESAALEPAAELVAEVLKAPASQSVVLVLPGLWCLDDVVARLGEYAPTLYVDVNRGNSARTCALAAALDAVNGPGGSSVSDPLGDRLEQWSREAFVASGSVPWVVAEFANLMDGATAALLHEFAGRGWIRLLLPMRHFSEKSELSVALQEAGSLVELFPQRLREQAMGRALEAWVGAPVSITSQRRISALSGGHVALARRVVETAILHGVLRQRDDMWIWEPDEQPLHVALENESGHLLSGLTDSERTLLKLTAVAGRIPEQWAVEEFSDAVVLSLRHQGILGPDYKARLGSVDLRIQPEALRESVRRVVREIGAISLWYEYGKRIPRLTGSALSEAALVCWAARSGEPIPSFRAQWAARVCISHGWYEQVAILSQALSTIPPAMRALRARAEYARGDVAGASKEMHQLLTQIDRANGDAMDHKTQREALILARRMSLFHPEAVGPIVERLTTLGAGASAPSLERVVAATQADDSDHWVGEMLEARLHGTWEESVTAQLCVGVKLGLRMHPELGRLVLSSLLDDLIREGGQPDIEEAVVAVLLLIVTAQGWRTDMMRVHFQIWNGRTIRGPALPGVASVVAAIVAMQQDRMHSAHLHAAAALRAFDMSDPYGLAPFSASLVMATASYLDEETGARARRNCSPRVGTGRVDRGLPSLRLATQGMALIGSGPPTPVVAAALLPLARQAREESELLQEQQLLLLSVLGMSTEAAEMILEAPWGEQPGRPSMIYRLAEALTTSDDRLALETADVFIAASSQHFGLSILAALWARREGLDNEIRARVAKTVLSLRQELTEHSLLISTFEELTLGPRERSVLEALHRGDTTRAIARMLSVSPRTVEATVSALLKRFGCANRVELIGLDLLTS
ncbi:helix-turn-helix transcriptional regulator [Nesterenkonia haasae]|uniref:helix-turn-helix transcriptional regulator n=1 Tax=Nesterenkonia haasae TaxID=2587813 RepID=UPI00192EA9D1|nr:LuxR C-terminal-related transcriptional regulator [Nesterenkonia haasae]